MKALRRLSFCIALLLIFASCGNNKKTNSNDFSSPADSSSVIQHIARPESYRFSFDSLEELLKEHQNGYSQYFKEAALVESEKVLAAALKTFENFKDECIYFPTFNGEKMTFKKGYIQFVYTNLTDISITCVDSNNDIWEFGFFYRNDFTEADLDPDKYCEGTLQSGEKTFSSYLDRYGDSIHFYIIVKSLNVHIKVSTNASLGNYIEQTNETEEGIDVKTFFNPNFGLEKIADPLNSTQK